MLDWINIYALKLPYESNQMHMFFVCTCTCPGGSQSPTGAIRVVQRPITRQELRRVLRAARQEGDVPNEQGRKSKCLSRQCVVEGVFVALAHHEHTHIHTWGTPEPCDLQYSGT